jgi:dienelactone hydrolase
LALMPGASGELGGGGAPAREPITGELVSATGCVLDYRLYLPPEGAASAPMPAMVILGHGFLRSQDRMSGLAEAIAADGIPAATLDFCNMRPWDGRHQQNGLDMIALARHLGAANDAGADGPEPGAARAQGERVVYAGFSAGALAALVAARNDPSALGVVTLDLVDAQGLGREAARGLDKPLIGLSGEPTNCNANDNARGVFAATRQASRVVIPGASHCDFEAPTDALCELLCADPDQAGPERTARLREQIQDETLQAIQSLFSAGAGASASASATAIGSGQASLAGRG